MTVTSLKLSLNIMQYLYHNWEKSEGSIHKLLFKMISPVCKIISFFAGSLNSIGNFVFHLLKETGLILKQKKNDKEDYIHRG
jgi:hypothetical protein